MDPITIVLAAGAIKGVEMILRGQNPFGTTPITEADPQEKPFHVFTCPTCGNGVRAKSYMAGEDIFCPNCDASIMVPDDISNMPTVCTSSPPTQDFPISFVCPHCKNELHAKGYMAGTTLPCKHCHVSITVPSA